RSGGRAARGDPRGRRRRRHEPVQRAIARSRELRASEAQRVAPGDQRYETMVAFSATATHEFTAGHDRSLKVFGTGGLASDHVLAFHDPKKSPRYLSRRS